MFHARIDGDTVTYPYTLTDYKRANPNVSIRSFPEPEALESLGMVPVTPTPQPKYDPVSQDCNRSAKLVKGKWVEVWTVTDAPDAVERLKNKRESTVVTMRQARLALLEAGLLKKVADAIAAIPNTKQKAAAEIDWEYAVEVRRKSPLIKALAPALGLSNEQIDALFEAAALIE